MFEDSSSSPTDMKYLGKLPYTNAQFYSDDPIVTDSGNIIVLTKNGFLQVYIDNNNGPVWTKTIEDMKCAAISDDGSTIAVATSMDLDNCT
ncbi:MAG: hypothetical protein CW716_10965 [Candidatus Bathyarchaeum sp.]|nr:MAG: hypothetical protein CW716_10965 [Candidatus Bathyarchaeum sp.]